MFLIVCIYYKRSRTKNINKIMGREPLTRRSRSSPRAKGALRRWDLGSWVLCRNLAPLSIGNCPTCRSGSRRCDRWWGPAHRIEWRILHSWAWVVVSPIWWQSRLEVPPRSWPGNRSFKICGFGTPQVPTCAQVHLWSHRFGLAWSSWLWFSSFSWMNWPYFLSYAPFSPPSSA